MAFAEAHAGMDTDEGIKRAIGRICESLSGGFGPAADAPSVQKLIDAFLDVRPASSTLALEQRLLSLCQALEELGPMAADAAVVERAVDIADCWN
jgi:hypothetical protein